MASDMTPEPPLDPGSDAPGQPGSPPAAPSEPPPPPSWEPPASPPPSGSWAPPPPPPGYGPPPDPPPGYDYYGRLLPTDVLGRPLAAWWKRVVAIIVDSLIVGIPSTIVFAWILGLRTHVDVVTQPSGQQVYSYSHWGAGLAGNALTLIVALIYFGALDGGVSGQTVGKRLMGIATRDAGTGGPVGFGRAVLRRFVYEVLFLIFVVPGLINCLWPLWDPHRQAWHDKVAETQVVEVGNARSAPAPGAFP